MGLPQTKVNIPKVQTDSRTTNQLQQNIIDAFSKLQAQIRNLSTSVGESKAAYLTETQFQADWGTGWVLQDGRSCVGSAYEANTGNKNVPKAVGRVLRMADNGAGVNPDGNLPLGSNQDDAFESHTHIQDPHTHTPVGSPVVVQNAGTTSAVGYASGANPFQFSPIPNTTAINQSTGGNETRMKNTTCNFFIRIN